MKDKILAAIKAKFPKVNLSKSRLNAIAAKIETKVIDDETKIDVAIDDYNDFNPLADIAKLDDKIRNLEASKPAPAKKEEETKSDPDLKDDPEMPAWAKALVEQNKALSASIATFQGERQQQSIKGQIAAKLKDVPEIFWSKRGLPDKAENLDAFIEDVTADYQTFTQAQTDKGLLSIPPPGGGQQQQHKSAVSPEIKAFVEKQSAAEKK